MLQCNDNQNWRAFRSQASDLGATPTDRRARPLSAHVEIPKGMPPPTIMACPPVRAIPNICAPVMYALFSVACDPSVSHTEGPQAYPDPLPLRSLVRIRQHVPAGETPGYHQPVVEPGQPWLIQVKPHRGHETWPRHLGFRRQKLTPRSPLPTLQACAGAIS